MSPLNFLAKKEQCLKYITCVYMYVCIYIYMCVCMYVYIYTHKFFYTGKCPISHPISEMRQTNLCLQWKWGINKSWQMSLRLLRFELLWELSMISLRSLQQKQLLSSGDTRRAEQGKRRSSARKAEERQQEQITYSVLCWRKPPPALWGPRKRERERERQK